MKIYVEWNKPIPINLVDCRMNYYLVADGDVLANIVILVTGHCRTGCPSFIRGDVVIPMGGFISCCVVLWG